MDERLTELEIKFTHQEQAIEELNELVTEQQELIEKLLLEQKRLTEQAASGDVAVVDASLEAPPPHY